MVEEIFNHITNDSIRRCDGTRIPTALHRLQLPEGFRLVDRRTRAHVLLPLQQFLQAYIHQGRQETIVVVGGKAAGCYADEWNKQRYNESSENNRYLFPWPDRTLRYDVA